MIELTEEQIDAMEPAEAAPTRVVNPRTREAFVLLPADEYVRLTAEVYDDTPWTREELHAAAWAVGVGTAGWEEMDEYDDRPEQP